jgi:hypothetical protein
MTKNRWPCITLDISLLFQVSKMITRP